MAVVVWCSVETLCLKPSTSDSTTDNTYTTLFNFNSSITKAPGSADVMYIDESMELDSVANGGNERDGLLDSCGHMTVHAISVSPIRRKR
ncbi:hypothetical protein L1987_45087 [Smallanthus sonchifolius]|uniref:Uncharacterized protein n=1 Tax=Smallanthus sonchifolius TaxID=185202 RepID=A0ACB9GRW9_9ASTR|nr:hypothetical protein L1987_45087 [Smallanthus sonchifolius]